MKASMILSIGAAAAVSAHKNETYTTSTVYATSIYTVLSCAPTVTNCPVGHVTTDIVSLYTTVCPVTATETPVAPYPTAYPSGGESTSTLYSTELITISKCAETVTNCPYTTAPVTSTKIYPAPSPSKSPVGTGSVPAYVPTTSAGGVVSKPPVAPTSSPAPVYSTVTISTCIPSYITKVITVSPTVTPVYSATAAPSAPVVKPSGNSTIPFTGGASAKSAGGLLMAIGLVAALL